LLLILFCDIIKTDCEKNILRRFKIMKKFFTVVLAIIFTFALVPTPAVHMHEARATTARVGELIEFGGRDWRVLDVDGNHALILHETVIRNQPYHHKSEEVTWETSSLREWLNGEFLNSFNERTGRESARRM
jgi:hypothetical protein